MNNLNSVLIEGVLSEDPLFRVAPEGTQICTFTVVSRRYAANGGKTREELSRIQIESWGKPAEACSNLGKKGRGVRVVGRLKEARWTGADGKEKAKVIIVAEHVEWRPETDASTGGKKRGKTRGNDER
jgi:single-strand DNA-binding protein